jgi:hypothetical protein
MPMEQVDDGEFEGEDGDVNGGSAMTDGGSPRIRRRMCDTAPKVVCRKEKGA